MKYVIENKGYRYRAALPAAFKKNGLRPDSGELPPIANCFSQLSKVFSFLRKAEVTPLRSPGS